MIVDKEAERIQDLRRALEENNELEYGGDAPPAYDDLVDDSNVLDGRKYKDLPQIQEGKEQNLNGTERSSALGTRVNAIAGPSNHRLAPRNVRPLGSPTGITTSTSSSSWFSSSKSSSQTDIRVTVLGLLRDLVRQAPLPTSLGILDSCANACRKHSLSFSTLLQEPHIEGHTPLYWAVIKWMKQQQGPEDDGSTLLARLISYTAPLALSTLADIRLACLSLNPASSNEEERDSSNNSIFQRLRQNPLICPPTGTDSILLDATPPNASPPTNFGDTMQCYHQSKLDSSAPIKRFDDSVRVWEDGNVSDGFAVQLQIAMFQQRMRVSRSIVIEFIARGRLWVLQFFVIPPYADPSPSSVRPSTLSHISALQRLHNHIADSNSWLKTVSRGAFAEGTWAIALGLLEGSAPVGGGVQSRITVPSIKSQKLAAASQRAPAQQELTSSTSLPSASANSEDTQIPPNSSPLADWVSSIPGSFTPFLSRLPSNPSTAPQQSAVPKDALVLNLRPYPFTAKESDVNPNKAGSGQLLAPPLPPFPPSSTDANVANDKGGKRRKGRRASRQMDRERKEEEGLECSYDVLASFEERKGAAFDGSTHIDSDGTLHAILEARLLKSGEGSDSDSNCVVC